MPNRELTKGLDAALAGELERWRAAGLERVVPAPASPQAAADFTSNDYLGLAQHPAVIERARLALEQWGAGGRASRLLGGGSAFDEQAERATADWLGTEAALLVPSGYHANLGLLGALAGPGDRILSDALNHASLIDGTRLSRATVEVYGHRDLAQLERLLALPSAGRTLVVTESIFSMDGNLAQAHFNMGLMYMTAGAEFPGLDEIQALTKAKEEFTRYRNLMGPRLRRDDPTEQYLEDLDRQIDRTRRRLEREARNAARQQEGG